jgi:hypothetical protein
MKDTNTDARVLEKLFYTIIVAQQTLRELCLGGDNEAMAYMAGDFLEQSCRAGVNHLVHVAEHRPESLKSRASICSDWPGFVPEHKAARDANSKMFNLLGLGSAVSYKVKDTNLGTPLQEIVSSLYFELVEARALYENFLKKYGGENLPAWMHEAAKLPDLPGTLEDRERWFNCAWEAFKHGSEEVNFAHNSHIQSIGFKLAKSRAESRKNSKLRRARKKLKELEEDIKASDPGGKILPPMLETPVGSDLVKKIEDLKSAELAVRDSEILEGAKFLIKKAFLGRTKAQRQP